MLRRRIHWLLFLSSYAPLFVIVSLRSLSSPIVAATSLGMAAVSCLVLFWVPRTERQLDRGVYPVDEVADRTADVSGYVASYLIPFVFASNPSPLDLLTLGIVLVVVGVIYVNSNLLYINPVLTLAGFRMFEIRDTRGRPRVLICRRRPAPPSVLAHELTDGVLLEAESDGRGGLGRAS